MTNGTVMGKISDALDMEPLVVGQAEESTESPVLEGELVVPEEPRELSKEDQEAEEDFQLARSNIKETLDLGSQAYEQMIRIASASEHPRAFEVASNFMKNLVEANEKLLNLHDKRRQIVPVPEPEEKKQNVTNNNVFVGSTAELLEMIKKNKIKESND